MSTEDGQTVSRLAMPVRGLLYLHNRAEGYYVIQQRMRIFYLKTESLMVICWKISEKTGAGRMGQGLT